MKKNQSSLENNTKNTSKSTQPNSEFHELQLKSLLDTISNLNSQQEKKLNENFVQFKQEMMNQLFYTHEKLHEENAKKVKTLESEIDSKMKGFEDIIDNEKRNRRAIAQMLEYVSKKVMIVEKKVEKWEKTMEALMGGIDENLQKREDKGENGVSVIQERKRCEECGKKQNLVRCGKCKKVFYCSKECQIANWKKHKEICKI